jgi:hypothetical protein
MPSSFTFARLLIVVVLIAVAFLGGLLVAGLVSTEDTATTAKVTSERNALRLEIIQHARKITVTQAAQTAYTDCKRSQRRDALLAGLVEVSLEAGRTSADSALNQSQREARARFEAALHTLQHPERCMQLDIVQAARNEFQFTPHNGLHD